MRRNICFVLALILCLTGCAAPASALEQKYTKVYFDLFDSVVTIIGYASDENTFESVCEQARARLETLHMLFDKYNEYEGLNNLCTLNDQAGTAPVKVDKELYDIIAFAKRETPKLRGSVNIAMGGVLNIWHDYRETGTADPANAALPPIESLISASEHQDIDDVILSEADNTVYFRDPELQLDLGAVAKGYAAELVARELDASDMPSYILNAGGNIRIGKPPLDGRSSWSVGIQDPDALYGERNIDVICASEISVVTSGDYERYYTVDNVRYAHIISPDTLMPAVNNRSVTAVHKDSALCDLLSTALFVLTPDEGLEVLSHYPGAEAYWVTASGEILYTGGMSALLKSLGASDK